MSDDLVAQLKEQAFSDHVRGCEGRQYSCDCGYDIRTEGLLEQAATALSEARAEIERLRANPPLLDAQSLPGVDALVKTLEAQLDEALRSCLAEREGRLKAEAAISTLRARVREVVGPFASADMRDCKDFTDNNGRPYQSQWLANALHAARQLNEDLK